MAGNQFTRACIAILLAFFCAAFSATGPEEAEEVDHAVARCHAELLEASPELREDAEFNELWKAFYGLFSPTGHPSARRTALDWYRKCQQTPSIQQDFVVEYMRRVVELSKTPDAELQFLLWGMRSFLNRSDSANAPAALLAQVQWAEAGVGRSEELDRRLQDKYGYSEEQRITYAYNNDRTALSIDYDLGHNATSVGVHTLRPASGGLFYGSTFGDSWNRYETIRGFGGDFVMIRDGIVHFLHIEAPEEKDFFLNPPDPEAVWHYPPQPEALDGAPRLSRCEMAVRYRPLSDDDLSVVVAELYQINQGHYNPAWQCVPQCSIPYKLEDDEYRKQPLVCQPDGQWGVVFPEDSN